MHGTQTATIIAGALIVILGIASSAQTPSTISERVRTTMLAREPGWQLEKSEVDNVEVFQRWVNRAESITITYTDAGSTSDAAAWMKKLPYMMSSGSGESLSGVGDQAMIWPGIGRVNASVFFIKGKAQVNVTGPSRTIATRIARLVAAQID